MLCVKCGFSNAEGANYCTRCNAQLPRLVQAAAPDTEAETPRINERLQQIESAVQKALSGEWEADRFGQFLDEMATVLAEKERDIREIPIPPEAEDDFRDELEVGYAGIEMYGHGVQRMFSFLEDFDPAHLDAGLELVRQGNEHINEAMRINRENRRKLEEMYTDSSTMM